MVLRFVWLAQPQIRHRHHVERRQFSPLLREAEVGFGILHALRWLKPRPPRGLPAAFGAVALVLEFLGPWTVATGLVGTDGLAFLRIDAQILALAAGISAGALPHFVGRTVLVFPRDGFLVVVVDNLVVRFVGLGVHLHLLDMHHHGDSSPKGLYRSARKLYFRITTPSPGRPARVYRVKPGIRTEQAKVARRLYFFPARSFFCCCTMAATSASSFFASYTIPSLIVYLIPPTRSTWPVRSFRRTAPVPYSTLRFCRGF